VTDRTVSRDDVQTLYDAHGRTLLAYARSLLGDIAAAEDVLHQVFIRLLRGDVRILGAPLPYLCRAIRNAASNYRRGRARDTELADGAEWLEAPGGMEDAALALQQALDALPGDQRDAIVLHVWGQMTFQDIAEALEISPNTAASRYRYGLSKLRERLKPLGAE
jgi:RNA polymerase sigma-70 factor (ECF subfamily)